MLRRTASSVRPPRHGILLAAYRRHDGGTPNAVTLRKTTFVIAVMALLPAATCGSRSYRMPVSAEGKRTDSIAIPKGTKRLEVQFHDGLFAVEHGEDATCDIETRLQADDSESLVAYERAAEPVVEHRERDGVLTIRIALPPGARMDAVRSAWRVRAPKSLTVAVSTRRGAVVARGLRSGLEVEGGSGVVEATLDDGSAQIATTSGSLILRGNYKTASVRSANGRIDLALPPRRIDLVDVRASTQKGELFVDVGKLQLFDLLFLGEPHLVRCDPEVRNAWIGTETRDGVSYARGRLGDLSSASCGTLQVEAQGPISVRLLPDNPFCATESGN